MCRECQRKVEETYEFVCKVKSSDQHLKSLLPIKRNIRNLSIINDLSNTNAKTEQNESELILIVVPKYESEVSSLPSALPENGLGSSRETGYGYFDHTYPSVSRMENRNVTGISKKQFFTEGSTFFTCQQCKGLFADASKYLSHVDSCFRDAVHLLPLICPMCQFSDKNKDSYVDHLKTHQSQGLIFFKLNPNVSPIQISPENVQRKLFKICLKGCRCDKCGKYSRSLKSVSVHARECHGWDFKLDLVYSCPACGKVFTNDRTGFVKHLSSHKRDNVDFVKVNDLGIPVPLKKNEKAFLNFTQAKTRISRLSEMAEMSAESKQSPKPGCGSINVSMPKAVFEASEKTCYVCDECSNFFGSKNELAKHLKLHAVGEREVPEKSDDFVCEKCGLKCTGRISYDKHFSRHSERDSINGNRPTCHVCGKTFASRKKLGQHSELHEESEKLGRTYEKELSGVVCEICGTRFSSSGLSKHKKLHVTDKENSGAKCKICDRNFSNPKTFDRHLAAHLNPNYFECNLCKLPLPSASGLEKHLETHKAGSATHDCSVCNLSFLSKDALTCHRARTGHVGGTKPLECNVCHEKFYVGKQFARHIKLHPKYKTTECTLCGKHLSTHQSLSLHMDRHFESNGILCPHCGKRFFEERNYRRHLLTHQGIRPYTCDVKGCQKSFYTLFEIKRHKKYHFDTRDFACPYCSKKFHEANHLKVHIRTHTGEKPYVCPHCQKGFVTRTRCKQHIKLIHQGVGYDLIRTDISKKVPVFESVQSLN